MPLNPFDVHYVASLLCEEKKPILCAVAPELEGSCAVSTLGDADDLMLQEDGEISNPTADWDGCPEARYRSAISRAYYSAFLLLKERMYCEKADTLFPRTNSHGVFLDALADSLGTNNEIQTRLSALLLARKHADYDLQRHYVGHHAEDIVDKAADLLELVGEIPQPAIVSMAEYVTEVTTRQREEAAKRRAQLNRGQKDSEQN